MNCNIINRVLTVTCLKLEAGYSVNKTASGYEVIIRAILPSGTPWKDSIIVAEVDDYCIGQAAFDKWRESVRKYTDFSNFDNTNPDHEYIINLWQRIEFAYRNTDYKHLFDGSYYFDYETEKSN